MKKIIAFLCFITQCAFWGSAQSIDDSTLKKVFLFEQFVEGTVLLKSGGKEQATLNYNTYNQQIHFIQNGQNLMLTNLLDIDTVYIQDKKFVPINDVVYELAGSTGEIGLYITYTNKLRPITATTDHNGTSRKDNNKVTNTVSNVYVMRPYRGEFVAEIKTHYWLRRGNSLYKANNESQVMKVFPFKDNAAIKNYLGENKPDFNKPEEVVKLVNYCNSLMK